MDLRHITEQFDTYIPPIARSPTVHHASSLTKKNSAPPEIGAPVPPKLGREMTYYGPDFLKGGAKRNSSNIVESKNKMKTK